MSDSTRQRSLWFGAAGVSAILLILLFCVSVAPAPATSRATATALRVQLDPETGEMVPVSGLDKAELNRQMAQRLNRSAVGLAEVHHADGSVSLNLDGRYQSLLVATCDTTGNVHTGCVTSQQELAKEKTRAGKE